MSFTAISVRPIIASDIPMIIHYWLDADPDYLIGMGVDLKRLPSASDLRHMLETQIKTPIRSKESFALIWLVKNVPIGHSNLTDIQYGNTAKIHLHIWDKKHRQKGIGSTLFIQSLAVFFEQLALKEITCEPYVSNPSPHQTLKKIGFKFLQEYTTIPGSLNFEQTVKQWQMLRHDFVKIYPQYKTL